MKRLTRGARRITFGALVCMLAAAPQVGAAETARTGPADSLVAVGNEESDREAWISAVTAYEAALRLDPERPDACRRLGFAYFKMKHWPESIEAYQRSFRIAPNVEALAGLATVYEKTERWQDEVATLQQAVRLQRDCAWAYFQLGMVYDRLARYRDAIAALRHAARLRPDDADALFHLGVVYGKAGRWGDEVEALTRATRVKPDFAAAYFHLARAAAKRGKRGEEIAALQEFVRLLPDVPTGHYALGRALAASGNQGAARVQYDALQALHSALADSLQAALAGAGRP